MGQFTITLPDKRSGYVIWGKSTKIATLFRLLPWVKGEVEEKTGYKVKIKPDTGKEIEYRLFKTKEGKWFQDEDSRRPLEGETLQAIKQAIEQHENTAE